MTFFSKIQSNQNPFIKRTDLPNQGHDMLEESAEMETSPVGGSQATQDEAEELAVDVYNTQDSIIIVAQLAGVENSDLYIKVKDDVLTISGKKKQPSFTKDIQHYLHTSECAWGNFSRPIILPQTVDIQRVNAKLTKEQVLILTIPKTEVSDEQIVKVELEG